MSTKIDELNINKPTYEKRSMPYERYFGEMELTDAQKKERILFAHDVEDIFTEFLIFMGVLMQYNRSPEPARDQLETKYKRLMKKHLNDDDQFIAWYAAKYAQDVTDSTVTNVRKEIQRALENPDLMPIMVGIETEAGTAESAQEEIEKAVMENSWFFSEDRAMFNGENEANSVLNRKDFFQAIKEGFTHKTWKDMRDDRVRATHLEVGGTTIPITERFQVGAAQMLYPKEKPFEYPEECVSCRCWLVYSRR